MNKKCFIQEETDMTIQQFVDKINAEYLNRFENGRGLNMWDALRVIKNLMQENGIIDYLSQHGIRIDVDSDCYSQVKAVFTYDIKYTNPAQSLFARRYSGRVPVKMLVRKKKKRGSIVPHHIELDWYDEVPDMTMDVQEYFLKVIQEQADHQAVFMAKELCDMLETCAFMAEHNITPKDLSNMKRTIDFMRQNGICMVPYGTMQGPDAVIYSSTGAGQSFFNVALAMAKEYADKPPVQADESLEKSLCDKIKLMESIPVNVNAGKIYLITDDSVFAELVNKFSDVDGANDLVKKVLPILQRAEVDFFAENNRRVFEANKELFLNGKDASGKVLHFADGRYKVMNYRHKSELHEMLQDGDVVLVESSEDSEKSGAWRDCASLGYCPVLGEHSNPTVFDCDKHCPDRNEEESDVWDD